MPFRGWMLVSCVLLAAAVVRAFPGQPEGVLQARFGMSVEEVRKLYPDMKEIDREEVEAIYRHSEMRSFRLAGQKLPDFETPADLVLRFFDGRLWAVHVRLSEADARVAAWLFTRMHGEPTYGGRLPSWVGEKASIRMVPGGYEVVSLKHGAKAWERMREVFEGTRPRHEH